MITTPITTAVGISGRAALAAAPTQPTAEQPFATPAETSHAVKAPAAPDRSRQYIAEREHAMRARLTRQLAEAADQERVAATPQAPQDSPDKERVEPIDMLPPPATEVLAKGGKQTRLEARAELFEAEARLRILEKASAGYKDGRSATS